MRARTNETSEAILAALTLKPMSSSDEVGRKIGANTTTVSTLLLRMVKAGTVGREKVQEGEIVIDEEEGIVRKRFIYRYGITERGKKRLAWIRASRKQRE